jgi:hypothetical protein
MAAITAGETVGIGSHRTLSRAISATSSKAAMNQPMQQLVDEASEARSSARGSGADLDFAEIRTYPSAPADDRPSTLEQASESLRRRARSRSDSAEASSSEFRSAGRARHSRAPYQAEGPRAKKIDLIA